MTHAGIENKRSGNFTSSRYYSVILITLLTNQKKCAKINRIRKNEQGVANSMLAANQGGFLGMGNQALLDVTDTARLLNVGRTKIYDMVRRGDLPAIHVGKSVRFSSTILDQWLVEKMTGVSVKGEGNQG